MPGQPGAVAQRARARAGRRVDDGGAELDRRVVERERAGARRVVDRDRERARLVPRAAVRRAQRRREGEERVDGVAVERIRLVPIEGAVEDDGELVARAVHLVAVRRVLGGEREEHGGVDGTELAVGDRRAAGDRRGARTRAHVAGVAVAVDVDAVAAREDDEVAPHLLRDVQRHRRRHVLEAARLRHRLRDARRAQLGERRPRRRRLEDGDQDRRVLIDPLARVVVADGDREVEEVVDERLAAERVAARAVGRHVQRDEQRVARAVHGVAVRRVLADEGGDAGRQRVPKVADEDDGGLVVGVVAAARRARRAALGRVVGAAPLVAHLDLRRDRRRRVARDQDAAARHVDDRRHDERRGRRPTARTIGAERLQSSSSSKTFADARSGRRRRGRSRGRR